MHTIQVNLETGEVAEIPYTPEEEAEWIAKTSAYVEPASAPEPTKSQLLAELAILTAKIQALA